MELYDKLVVAIATELSKKIIPTEMVTVDYVITTSSYITQQIIKQKEQYEAQVQSRQS